MSTKSSDSLLPFHLYLAIGVLIGSIVFLLLFWYAIDIFLLVFAGILLAIFLRTLSNYLKEKIPMPDALSVTLVLLALLALLLLFISLTASLISTQTSELLNQIPSAWEKVKQYLNMGSFSIGNLNFDRFVSQGQKILPKLAIFFSTTLGFIGSTVVFLFLGIFFAYDPETYIKGGIQLIPKSQRSKTKEILNSTTEALRWWLLGKLISMAIIGVFTSLGLWMLGVPLASILGLIAAILTFIPNIGPILAAIPAVLLGFVQGPMTAVYVLILYTVIQAIESYIITPLIQRRTISLPPALIIIVQLIMALLTGILGLALATPLLAAISTIIDKVYIEDTF